MVDQIHRIVTFIHKQREHSGKGGRKRRVGRSTSGCVGVSKTIKCNNRVTAQKGWYVINE